MKISVCLIVKDEELVIERCLCCVQKFADEIIVVDTGSKDRTKELAKKFTDKVFDFEWDDDFSKARNFSFSKATLDYVMWLDADDIVLDEDIKKINELKQSKAPADAYMFYYVLAYDENFTPISIFKRERLFKRDKNFLWHGFVHEYVEVNGDVRIADIKIYHKKMKINEKNRNLRIFLAQKRKKVAFSPREQFFYAREYYFSGRYNKAIKELKKYLNMPGGWVVNRAQAYLDMADCYDILGRQDMALQSLSSALTTSLPKAEVFCKLGDLLLRLSRIDEAIFWLELALQSKIDLNSGAFVNEDNYCFLPSLQLCYAHFVKGDIKKSYEFHKLSLSCKPNDERVQQNQKFFDKYFEKNKI